MHGAVGLSLELTLVTKANALRRLIMYNQHAVVAAAGRQEVSWNCGEDVSQSRGGLIWGLKKKEIKRHIYLIKWGASMMEPIASYAQCCE